MGKYNLGEVWWTQFPFEEIEVSKCRPAIVIDESAGCLLNMKVTTSYVINAPHCKYSESDKVYKQYKHTLYSLSLSSVPENMVGDVFELDHKKYAWKSIQELESDSNIMSKNDDIIAFCKN